jgi:hypothetical protein
LDTEAGVARAEASGDSLDEDFGLWGNEDRHGWAGRVRRLHRRLRRHDARRRPWNRPLG